jgi:hypothetical protein
MALTKVNSILVDGAINTTAAGNVGIGTASPDRKLVVSEADGSVTARFQATSGAIRFLGYRSAETASVIEGVNTAESAFAPLAINGSQLQFLTGATERMRIDSSGSLLVGTTVSPQSSGASGLELYNAGSYGRINLGKTASGTFNGFAFYHNASIVGTVTYSNTATAYNTSSDYRLKENIAPMTGALAKVLALKPVTYTWKLDGSNGQGFIAHELQAVVPDCVTGEKDAVETVDDLDAEGNKIGTKEVPSYQGIDTSFLVATLTAAIQEQQAIITDLKARIETLEAK